MRTGIFNAREIFSDRWENLKEELIFALVDGWYAVDADTILVIRDIGQGWLSRIYVRIAGVDAPERRGKSDLEKKAAELVTECSRRWMVQAVVDGDVSIDSNTSDRYANRVIGDVYSPAGGFLSHWLLINQLVRAYDGSAARTPWSLQELNEIIANAERACRTLPNAEPDRTWVMPAIEKFMARHGAN